MSQKLVINRVVVFDVVDAGPLAVVLVDDLLFVCRRSVVAFVVVVHPFWLVVSLTGNWYAKWRFSASP